VLIVVFNKCGSLFIWGIDAVVVALRINVCLGAPVLSCSFKNKNQKNF